MTREAPLHDGIEIGCVISLRNVERDGAFKAMLTRDRSWPRAYARHCERADVALGLALARGKDHPAIRGLAVMSEGGGWKALLAVSAGTLTYGLVCNNARLATAGRHMLEAGIVASIVKTTAKRLLHRTRPNVLMDTGVYRRGWLGPNEGPWQSFPSGHSALSVAVACAAARAYPEIRSSVYAGAAGVVLVQVLRGAHFPSDVIAGSLIGLTAEAATNAFSASPIDLASEPR